MRRKHKRIRNEQDYRPWTKKLQQKKRRSHGITKRLFYLFIHWKVLWEKTTDSEPILQSSLDGFPRQRTPGRHQGRGRGIFTLEAVQFPEIQRSPKPEIHESGSVPHVTGNGGPITQIQAVLVETCRFTRLAKQLSGSSSIVEDFRAGAAFLAVCDQVSHAQSVKVGSVGLFHPITARDGHGPKCPGTNTLATARSPAPSWLKLPSSAEWKMTPKRWSCEQKAVPGT